MDETFKCSDEYYFKKEFPPDASYAMEELIPIIKDLYSIVQELQNSVSQLEYERDRQI